MFSRRPDRPDQDPRSLSAAPTGVPGQLPPGPWGTTTPVPSPADPMSVAAAHGDATVVGARDQLEGTLRSAQGVLVLGRFTGAIESESWVRLGEGSTVTADITAQEVIVAGRCSGQIVAAGRLEIAATGHITGDIQTPRLLLHEGGVIDGGLYMTRTDMVRPGARRTSGGTAATAETGPTDQAGGTAQAGPTAQAGMPTPTGSGTPKASSVRDGGRGPSPRSGAATIPVESEPAVTSPSASAPAPGGPTAR